jgi:hypothetical protein
MTQPNFHDVELLSAALDGQLSPAESARLEMRLKTDPQLRALSDELSETQALLHRLPARRAPRNFTLTPKMAGVKPPLPRTFPLFRFASALAALLFVFSLTANLTFPSFGAAAPLPIYGMGGAAPMEAPAAAAPMAPAAPAATAAPAPTSAPAQLVPAAPSTQQEIAPAPTATPGLTPAAADQAQAKLAPTLEAAQPAAELPVAAQERIKPPVPTGVLIGLLLLSLLAGAAAIFVRWRADQEFSRRHK